MRLIAAKHRSMAPPRLFVALILFLIFVIQCEISVGYKSEIEITPAPIEEQTTKKSGGWFGGFKNLFRSSDTTTTTTTTTTSKPPPPLGVGPTAPVNQPNVLHGGGAGAGAGVQKPPPLVIPKAPLMPLGPRPDTPSSSPQAANSQFQPPQWPPAGASSATASQTRPQLPQQPQPVPGPNRAQSNIGGTPNLPPGFTPYRPQKPLPNGFDLSYGGAGNGAHAPNAGRPGFGLAPLTSTTTTTTTTTSKPGLPNGGIDLRVGGFDGTSTTTRRPQTPKDEFPALPAQRRPSIKEDFPALPTPKTPNAGAVTPTSPLRPSSPSAWNNPLSTPATPIKPSLPVQPAHPASPAAGSGGTNGVAFVPHVPGTHSTTTVRPGFQSTGNSVATDDEIRQLTEQLYAKETNSQLNKITVNIQGKTRSIDSGDEAPNPLLVIDEKALESPTIAKLRLLFNNYEEDTLVNEHVTPNERKEENDFVDAVMATSVMRQAMLFLQQKGLVSPDPKTHRDLVKELWFTQYSRGQGKIGSSGFEHVFVHEVKNGTIIGFHNWVYVGEEEKAGRFNYKGYMKELDLGNKGKVLKMRFTYNGLNKPVDTMFIGTSPELELALYTVCFQLRPDRTCPVSLGNSKFGIVVYSWRYRGKNLIGSAYPEI